MSENIELYPRLVVEGADDALEFYARAFGGTVTERFTDPGGRVVHAMVQAGPARFAVKDADDYDRAPAPGGEAGGVGQVTATGSGGSGVPVILALYVTDADAVAGRMVEGGAEVIFPVSDHPYGERAGRLRDPFGHLWMIAQRIENLTAEQIQERTTAMFD